MIEAYEVIVIGGGHAGCEAARAAARMGSKTLLLTLSLPTIGQMSCNPAMGGIAKGQIVREIDALGGGSGKVSDASAIQFRMLNRSKGPAMWSPRTQNDRLGFATAWRRLLEQEPLLHFWQDSARSLVIKNGRVIGVQTGMGLAIRGERIILTGGTFLRGRIHVGKQQWGGGRMGEAQVKDMSEQLIELGFESGRMKTGTPPRLDRRSIRYDLLEEQKGDDPPGRFSFDEEPLDVAQTQRSCHITYTNPEVHAFLRTHLSESPLYNGQIQSQGPRYCPSIEDKVVRFAERDRHQLFLEPEGWAALEVYVNGFSSSLPKETQLEALRKVKGLEEARFLQPGYAIEYDYFLPTQLLPTLESRLLRHLYLAGQVNGTTGYEEAACQGLVAGINAHQDLHNGKPLVLRRNEAYIGVLIDDLVHKGTDEPYRMFTSRAEHRLYLRQDNADLRLGEVGAELGLLGDARQAQLKEKKKQLKACLKWLKKEARLKPEEINPYLEEVGSSVVSKPVYLEELLKRPEVRLSELMDKLPTLRSISFSATVVEQAEIEVKYAPYLAREAEWGKRLSELEVHSIHQSFDYKAVHALSAEGREKLERLRPPTLGAAARISGVSASDISILSIYIGKR